MNGKDGSLQDANMGVVCGALNLAMYQGNLLPCDPEKVNIRAALFLLDKVSVCFDEQMKIDALDSMHVILSIYGDDSKSGIITYHDIRELEESFRKEVDPSRSEKEGDVLKIKRAMVYCQIIEYIYLFAVQGESSAIQRETKEAILNAAEGMQSLDSKGKNLILKYWMNRCLEAAKRIRDSEKKLDEFIRRGTAAVEAVQALQERNLGGCIAGVRNAGHHLNIKSHWFDIHWKLWGSGRCAHEDSAKLQVFQTELTNAVKKGASWELIVSGLYWLHDVIQHSDDPNVVRQALDGGEDNGARFLWAL